MDLNKSDVQLSKKQVFFSTWWKAWLSMLSDTLNKWQQQFVISVITCLSTVHTPVSVGSSMSWTQAPVSGSMRLQVMLAVGLALAEQTSSSVSWEWWER